jgi:ABC-type transport system substrate-binding protein
VLYSLSRFCSADSYSSFLVLDYLEGAGEYNQGKADRVTGLKVKDPYTLQVTLVKPVPFFINHISTPVLAVFPEEMEKKEYAEKAGLTMAVGTGPFVFRSMTETEVILNKNENYWDKRNVPRLDRIVFRVIKNDQTRLVSLKRGHIDLMVLPSSLFETVFNRDGTLRDEFGKNYEAKSVATFNSHLIGINNKAVTDENLRRAMFWGTDRAQMVASILYGHADVTGGTVPPGINSYQPPFEKSLFDIEKARRYVEKSAYKGEPIELLIHDLANSEQIGQIFQAQMAKIGVKIVLKKMDYGSVIGRMVKGESQLFSMFFEYAFSSPEPILINLFSTSKIPVPNFFHFSDPSVDSMLGNLYKMTDKKGSVKFCAEIEAKIMEEAPALFLYRQKYVVLYSKNLASIEVSGNSHYFLEKVRFKR